MLPAVLLASVVLGACGGDDGDDVDAAEVVRGYADGVLASYQASLASATAMDTAIDAFLAAPSDVTMTAAKDGWLAARDDYGVTESFRFYDGPIDNAETGTEGLINAWPMDEGYIDYVEGDPEAGIINDPATYPAIDADLLTSLNEAGGEANIATGWHAIEFLLWGQDLSADGPGARPATDYTTAANADRRATYLSVVSDLLVAHLDELVQAWSDGDDTYRAEFLDLPTDEALTKIITGAGELSRGELAGERMSVAFFGRSQEDEHSCFSDNTTRDIVNNASGVAMVLTGDFPTGARSPSVIDLVRAEDAELADRLTDQLSASVAATEAIPAPFDQILVEGLPDTDPARQSVAGAITDLEDQTDTIVAAAKAIGVTIEVT
ncbi:MAG: iron-regulated protein [Actinobacteria bacterium]|nr:iron-regulated protein [Actinomycetota bacterium]